MEISKKKFMSSQTSLLQDPMVTCVPKFGNGFRNGNFGAFWMKT